MSAGFTPGPWAVYHDSFSVCASDGHIISTFAEGSTADEATANARLIATAPELHDALEAVKEFIDAGEHQLAWEAANSALKKVQP